jgi:ATP-dependent DNA helicase RecQ
MSEKLAALKKYYGYDSFREGQEPIIDNILSGRDILAVMPTGAGKSICYQIPAILSPGITLVISPLISLMKDQVGALNQNGITAAYLNSSLTPRQYRLALDRAAAGAYKIIYVAPERLMTDSFLELITKIDISIIAVDEAHCVSQWGHDFRKSYLDICLFVDMLPKRPVVAAFTATATEQVKSDVRSLLNLINPYEITTGFDRPNLYFGVLRVENRIDFIKDYIMRNPGRGGIIYAMTRKNVEQIYTKLASAGIQATFYHAGLEDAQRTQNQDEFIRDIKPVMVATNAFGMGIDKPDVGFIIHYNLPLSMEAYYQEAGRAGRDGSEAECLLLYSEADIHTARLLISQSEDDEETDPEILEEEINRRQKKLEKMISYCKSTSCLRSYILRYFGEAPASKTCGKCSCCREEYEVRDITPIIRAIYSAIYATGERFGAAFITDFLHGDDNERMLRGGYTELSGFGSLHKETKSNIRDIITKLIDAKMLERTGDEYPILTLTPLFDRYYNENQRITMKFRKETLKPKIQRPQKLPVTYAEPDIQKDAELYNQLRAFRREMADKRGVPAYCIFTDFTLRMIVSVKPTTQDELARIRGVGDAFLERYGKALLEIINKYNCRN